MKKRARGTGTVYRRRDGRWEVQYRLGDGRRKSLYAGDRREACRLATDLRWTLATGLPVIVASRTLADYLDTWLQVTATRVRPTTLASYRRDVARLQAVLGSAPLGRLSPQVVQLAYVRLASQGLSARSVERTHAVLRRALNQAVAWGAIRSNPALLAAPPKPLRRPMTALDASQARRLLEITANDRMHLLWAVLIGTGLRLGEALALTWADVDLAAGRISVRRTLQRQAGVGLRFAPPKTPQSRRCVPIPEFVLAELAGLQPGSPADLVFKNRNGLPQDSGSISWRLRRDLGRAGLPRVRVHDLRHTTASILLAAGTHPKVVQDLLGHRTVALTLDVYSHLVPGLGDEAARALDRIFSVQPEYRPTRITADE